MTIVFTGHCCVRGRGAAGLAPTGRLSGCTVSCAVCWLLQAAAGHRSWGMWKGEHQPCHVEEITGVFYLLANIIWTVIIFIVVYIAVYL